MQNTIGEPQADDTTLFQTVWPKVAMDVAEYEGMPYSSIPLSIDRPHKRWPFTQIS